MNSEEVFREKENQYEYYGVCTSTIKTRMKDCLQDIIKSALDDSQKKLGNLYPEKDVKNTLQKMQTAYFEEACASSHEIDELIDNAFKVPSTDELNVNPSPNEEEVDNEIKILQTQLESLHAYHLDLLKYEDLFNKDEEMMDFTEQYNQIQKLEVSSQQLLNETQLIQDLFTSKEDIQTKELEDTVMKMSIC